MTPERIIDKTGNILAVVVKDAVTFHRGRRPETGIRFPTTPDSELQVGVMQWGPGHEIPAHTHPFQHRVLARTTEVVLVTSGGAVLSVYDDAGARVAAVVIGQGDLVVLYAGGHGFVAGENGFGAVEVKTGPYFGPEKDKVHRTPEGLWGQIDKA